MELSSGLKNLVYLATQHCFEIQEKTNKQLRRPTLPCRSARKGSAVTLNSIGDAVIATDAEGRVAAPDPFADGSPVDAVEAAGRPVGRRFFILSIRKPAPAAIR